MVTDRLWCFLTSLKHFLREAGTSPSRTCRTASISSLAAYPPRSLANRLKRSVRGHTHTHIHTDTVSEVNQLYHRKLAVRTSDNVNPVHNTSTTTERKKEEETK